MHTGNSRMKRLADWLFRTLGVITCIAAIVAVIGFFAMGSWLQLDEEPQKADYIVPLAGDKLRLMHAVELARQGYAPTLLLSNAASHPVDRYQQLKHELGWPKITGHEMSMLIIRHMGLDESRVDSFGDGHISTVEEAEALRAYLNGRKARLLVVTSPSHARRAQIILQDVLPDCEIIMSATPEDRFPRDWWKDQRSAQRIVLETAKLIHYWLGGVYRSTDAPAS